MEQYAPVNRKEQERISILLLFDLDLDLLDPSLHLGQILQHLEGVLEHVDLGLAVVDYLYRHFFDLIAKLCRPQYRLKIESKAVDLTS